MDDLNIYNCPIHETVGELKTMMAEEHDRQLIKVVQEIGIEIDRESLVQAINNDRMRYEQAYKEGYAECERHYRELLGPIIESLIFSAQKIKGAIE